MTGCLLACLCVCRLSTLRVVLVQKALQQLLPTPATRGNDVSNVVLAACLRSWCCLCIQTCPGFCDPGLREQRCHPRCVWPVNGCDEAQQWLAGLAEHSSS